MWYIFKREVLPRKDRKNDDMIRGNRSRIPPLGVKIGRNKGGILDPPPGDPKNRSFWGRFTLRNRDFGCKKKVFFAPAAPPQNCQNHRFALTDLGFSKSIFSGRLRFWANPGISENQLPKTKGILDLIHLINLLSLIVNRHWYWVIENRFATWLRGISWLQ